jgi:hypothetical protein
MAVNVTTIKLMAVKIIVKRGLGVAGKKRAAAHTEKCAVMLVYYQLV